ncbi:hypothetical protein AGMMS49992_26960 [Clostridia bacterium]|nr:hypothetical protein AGMMS49992_26960 [Clostridia bacterium]
MEVFAERIRRLRKLRGETQKDLADALDISTQSVTNWEVGARMPSLDVLIRAADHYSVTTDYLIGRSPSPMVYAQPVGEIDGQAATLLTTSKVPLSDADKAAVIASAQSPGAVVIDPRTLGLPKNREELEAFVLRLIENAKQHEH